MSGEITLDTGMSYYKSGDITLATGTSNSAAGGEIKLSVGDATSGDGGNLEFTAGEATAEAFDGGFVTIAGGHGSHSGDPGGEGGMVELTGGKASGANMYDLGGGVYMYGGDAASGTGGSLSLKSGVGLTTSSGDIALVTFNSGSTGVAGKIDLTSGTSSKAR